MNFSGSTIDMHVIREVVASDAVQAVQQVLRQQQPNGHHAPAAASSPPQIPKSATTVQRPPQLPPLPPPTSKRQAPLDSTTTTEPDDSVSLSSLSQPASSHSQKSLLNKSAVVSEVNFKKLDHVF